MTKKLEVWNGGGLAVLPYSADYWSKGVWGRAMDGIQPEPGIWVEWVRGETPEKVWPKEGGSDGGRPQ